GERRVPIATFFTGVRQTVLAPDELLVELAVPAPGAHSGGTYLRHTPRRELDIAVVGVASQLTLANGVCTKARVALAAVSPVPVRATAAERALEGQVVTPDRIVRAAELALEAARPLSDTRGAADARRHTVRTIEGLGKPGALHPLQEAFVKHGVPQCGFCIPGVLMAAAALLTENPRPTEEEIRYGIAGNLCRCTGYTKMLAAITETAGAA